MSCTICPKTKDYCLDHRCGKTTGICATPRLFESDHSEDIDVTQKESQEELWNVAADIVEDNIGRYYHDLPTGQLTLNIMEDLKKQFFLTRNSDNK